MSSSDRQRFLWRTYLACALPGALIAIALAVWAFVWITGLRFTSRLSETSTLQQAAFFATLIVALLLGFTVGGWLWSRLAKRYWALTKEEALRLFLSAKFRIGFLDAANVRAINRLFGQDARG